MVPAVRRGDAFARPVSAATGESGAWWCWASAWIRTRRRTSAFCERAKVSFLTARDPDNTINADYGTFKYPETYIINRDGKVVMKIISATDWTDEKMLSYVKSLL